MAAKTLGRSYIGIELDAKYHAIASRRLEQPTMSPARAARHAQALTLQ
jgi:DNA modification methylase